MKKLVATLLAAAMTMGIASVGAFAVEDDIKGTIQKGNDSVTVSLQLKEINGYEWVSTVENDRVAKVDDVVITPPAKSKLEGGQSNFDFKVSGLRSGSTEVVIQYQDMVGKRAVVETHTYLVKVDTKNTVTLIEKMPKERIEIVGNATTGYLWGPAKQYEEVCIAEYIYIPETSQLMGTGGTFVFPIVGMKAGTWKVTFENRQVGSDELGETKSFNVVVNRDLSIRSVKEVK